MTRTICSLALALLVALPTTASAENPTVNVQVFRPSPHHGDGFTVLRSDVHEHLRWSAGLMLNYGNSPLVFVDEGGGTTTRHEVIKDQLTLDLMGSISVADRLSIGLAVPLFLLNKGTTAGFITVDPEPSSFAMGDIRLSPKVGIILRDEDADGFGLGGELELNLPTGDADSFVSDGFTLTPRLIADFRAGPVLIAVNLGFRVRLDDEALPFNVDVSHEFMWRVGAEYEIMADQLYVLGEIYGASADYSEANNTHIEGVLGGRYKVPDSPLSFVLGGGSGFTKGYGNTKFRVFAGASFSPDVITDTDEDGLLDDADKCLTEPEDKDGFQDGDGCPDPDNDADGILDPSDTCPNEAEDKDGFEDADGCPDPDNDADGIPDASDTCPDVAEDKDSFQDGDGCPELDNDGDGIADTKDECPLEPETKNGHEDEDGCPDETLAKVEKGRIIIKEKIYFDTGKDSIKSESYPVLEAVKGIMSANPEIKKVSIEGHTDDRGSKKNNQDLSQRRAQAVVTWLTSNDIAADRLTAVGHGEEKPAVEGRSRDAREKNRRVEFIILDPPQDAEATTPQ